MQASSKQASRQHTPFPPSFHTLTTTLTHLPLPHHPSPPLPSQDYLWVPLTYQLAQAEQLPGAAYPENFTLAVHFPLPLPSPPSGEATAADALSEGGSSGAVVEPVWSMDAVGVDVGIDSRGGRLLMSGGKPASILSTM